MLGLSYVGNDKSESIKLSKAFAEFLFIHIKIVESSFHI